MSSRVLVVTPDFPFPAIHGGRVDYLNRIKCIKEFGHEIHLISTVKEDVPEEAMAEMKKYAAKISLVKRSESVSDLLSTRPYQVKTRKELSSIDIDTTPYDFLLLESEHVLEVLKNPALKYHKAYLRIHNNESRYFYALGMAAFPKPSFLYYFLDGFRFAGILKKNAKKFDKLLFISNKELEENAGLQNAVYLPPVYSRKDPMRPFRHKESRTVLFVGSFFMPNNLEAVEYYLREIHPALLDIEGYQLVLAGSTKSDPVLQEKIRSRFGNTSQLKLHFDLNNDRINRLYDEALVFVNPVLHGAGVKLKVLEAIRNGMLILSTEEGIAGTDLVNGREVFVADNATGMAQKLREVLTGNSNVESMVVNAQQKISESYDRLKDLFTVS